MVQQMLTEESAPNTMPATGLQNNYQFVDEPQTSFELSVSETPTLSYTALTLAIVILIALIIVGIQAAMPKPQTAPSNLIAAKSPVAKQKRDPVTKSTPNIRQTSSNQN